MQLAVTCDALEALTSTKEREVATQKEHLRISEERREELKARIEQLEGAAQEREAETVVMREEVSRHRLCVGRGGLLLTGPL